jgi:hypothetical protein
MPQAWGSPFIIPVPDYAEEAKAEVFVRIG